MTCIGVGTSDSRGVETGLTRLESSRLPGIRGAKPTANVPQSDHLLHITQFRSSLLSRPQRSSLLIKDIEEATNANDCSKRADPHDRRT